MGEIKSSFQRRKKSSSMASSNSNNTPPGHSMEASGTTPQPLEAHEVSHGSPGSEPLGGSPSTQSYRSNTGSREPKTPPATSDAIAEGQLDPSRILFQDVHLAHSPPMGSHLGPEIEDEVPSRAVWPESQLYNTTLIQPQSQYFTRPSPQMAFRDQESKSDPMQFLLIEEKSLNRKLQELLIMHADISMKGLSTQRVRKLIGQNFKSLAQIYEAMRELYEVQYKRRMDMLGAFETWESEKKMLMDEVQVIRSLDNDEGRRLVQLKEEELSVDEEIKKVEERLRQLKDKKGVLRSEIDQVESIIESRSSPHMEQLREIEHSEKLAIVKLSEEKSIVSQVSQMNLNEPTSMLGSFLMRFGAKSYVQPVSMLTPEQVMEVIRKQLDTFQDCVDDYLNKCHVFDECLLIWEDTADVLANLEKDLAVTLKSQTSNTTTLTRTKIESLLRKALEALEDRMSSFKEMNDVMKTLLMTEISTLRKGIELLDPKQKAPQFKPSPVPARAAPAKPTFITSSAAEPVLSSSPPDMLLMNQKKSKRTGSTVGDRLKDNLNSMNRTASSGTKGGKND